MTEKNTDYNGYNGSGGDAPRRPTRAPGSRSAAPDPAESARRAREARARERAARQREAEEEKAWLAERKRREQAAREAARARKRRQAKFLRFIRVVRNTLIVVLLLAVVLGLGAAFLGYRVTNSEKNFPNLYLDGIAVGGLTRQETLDKLNSQNWDANADIPLTVQLPVGSSFTVDRLRAGSKLAPESLYIYPVLSAQPGSRQAGSDAGQRVYPLCCPGGCGGIPRHPSGYGGTIHRG